MRARHKGSLTESQLPYLLDISHQAVAAIAPSSCPFCDEWEAILLRLNLDEGSENQEKLVVTPKQYREHVAAHMEQLALFALPRGRIDADEDVDSTGANPGAESGFPANEDFSDPSADLQTDPPLHVHAYQGNGAEVIRRLKAGENVNASGRTWGSALGASVAGEQPAVAKLLVNHGADIYMRCHDFETAIDAAQGVENDDIREILLDAIAIEERAEDHAAVKRLFEGAVVSINRTSALYQESSYPPAEWAVHLQVADEILRAFGSGIQECALRIDVNSRTHNRSLETGQRSVQTIISTVPVLCDFLRLFLHNFVVDRHHQISDVDEYTSEERSFWSQVDGIFEIEVETNAKQQNLQYFMEDCTQFAEWLAELIGGYVIIASLRSPPTHGSSF